MSSPAGANLEIDALEEEADPAKAYVSPRVVPKAALPTTEEAAKVVINLPGGAKDEKAAAELLAQETARINAERRREPTMRIPRQTVDAARSEIAAREGRRQAEEEILAEDAAPASQSSDARTEIAPLASESKRSSRGVVFAAVALAAAAGAAGVWYFGRAAVPAPSSLAANGDPPAKTATPTAKQVESKIAAPPLELTAEPPAKTADSSVVTLNAAAAEAPATATTPSDATGPGPHPGTGSAPSGSIPPGSVAVNGGWHPSATPAPHPPTPGPQTTQPPAIKPAAAPKGFTPSSI